MSNELKTSVETQEKGEFIFVDSFMKDEVWMSITVHHASAHVVMSVDQAKDLIAGLIHIVDVMEKVEAK